jgi:hypothetical protein
MSPVNGSASVPNLLHTLGLARQGIDNGLRSFDAVAQTVASDGTRGEVRAGNTVDAIAARDQVALAARLVSTADRMLGTLLDTRA